MESVLGPALPEMRALLLDRSLRARIKRRIGTSVDDESLRRQAAHFHRAMRAAPTPPFVHVERAHVAGRPAEWVRTSEAAAKVIVYFHGGGFFMSSPAEHRPLTWRLARATSRRVLAIDYRKAPDHAFPAWLDDAFAAYTHVLAQGHDARDVIVSGDSAGGNIALAVAHRARRLGAPMPGALILFSPWADLTCEGRTFDALRRRDAMFDGHAVRALGAHLTRACDPRDPEVSPLHGDFRGFPRVLTFAGSTEVFLDDARAVTRRARDAGVDARLYVFRHLPHVFPMFAGVVPRAKRAFEIIRAFADG